MIIVGFIARLNVERRLFEGFLRPGGFGGHGAGMLLG